MEGENQPGGEAKKKKWLEYGAIAAGGLVIAIVIMKKGANAGATTTTTSDPTAGMPIISGGSSGEVSSQDPATATALTQLAAGLADQAKTSAAQGDATNQALQSMQSQNAASLAAIQSLINRPVNNSTSGNAVSNGYGANAPVTTYPGGNGVISTIVGVQSNASVMALGGNAIQSSAASSTYVTNNPNAGQVNLTTVQNSSFANAKPESAMTGGSYSIVNYGGKTYNVDNATGQAYTG